MDTKQPLLSALTSSFPEVLRVQFKDGGGDRDVSIRALQGLGTASPYLTPNKIRDLWVEYSKHDVLFSDYTRGKLEPFVMALLNPKTFWFELFDNSRGEAIGIAMLSDIVPLYEAKGHFAFWDKIGSGKEPLIWGLMELCFSEFDLHRMSAETPVYQRGTIRTIKRLSSAMAMTIGASHQRLLCLRNRPNSPKSRRFPETLMVRLLGRLARCVAQNSV